MRRWRWAWACSAAGSRQPARGASARRASGGGAIVASVPWTPCPRGARRDGTECSSRIGTRVRVGHRLVASSNPQVLHVVIPVRFRLPSQRWLLPCLAIACLLSVGCRQQQAPAPVQPPPKTVVASGSEDAGAVSSDAKPAVPT